MYEKIDEMKIRQRLVNNDLFKFPRWKYAVGVSIALVTSFSWYAFFYVMRETIRVLCYWKTYHPSYFELLMLTDQEMLFYNFFFALISSIFGLNVCFQIWFNRVKKYNENNISYLRRSSIFTDITGLNAIFLFWFAKVAFIFAILGGIGLTWCYFQLYPIWGVFWILLVFVLFFEMWKTIRKIAFRKSRRWILISVTAIVIWSFLLSRIQFIDYKLVNENYINTSITRKNNIEYPTSDYYTKIEHRYLIVDIHLYFPVGIPIDSIPKVSVNQQEIGFDRFHEKVRECLDSLYDKRDHSLVTFVLHIDKNMPMKHVNMLQETMACHSFRRVGYRVFPSMDDCAKATPYAIMRYLPSCTNANNSTFADEYAPFFIKLTPDGLFTDSEFKKQTDISHTIQKFVIDHSNYLVILNVDGRCIYEDYIHTHSMLSKMFSELRNEQSIEKYQRRFDELPYEL